MSRLKSNLITTGIVLGLLIVMLAAFLCYPFRSGDAVRVSFLGYTNDVSGIKYAVFTVTNTIDERISYAQFTPEIKTSDYWSAPKCTHIPISLPAHGTDSYAVPAVTNAVAWRVLALWSSADETPVEIWRNKLVGNLNRNLYELQRGHWPGYYAVSGDRYYLTFSPAITNK